MSWDLVISVVSKVAEFFVEPIGRRIGYAFDYNSNLKKLEDEIKKLECAKEQVQVDVDEATKNGEEIFKNVRKWFASVDGVTQEGATILKDRANGQCFYGWCPNLKTRFRLSKKSKKTTDIAVELRGNGKFAKVGLRKPPRRIAGDKDFEGFESRNVVLENIVEALKDSAVNMVGVYVQRDNIYRLNVLGDQEAWNLFQMTAGDFDDSDVQPIAIDVARSCAGLTILIVTVASALKKKGFLRHNAREEMKTFDERGIEATTYKALKLSYNFLEVEQKSIFRLCGQLRPHCISIGDLLKYGMGFGIFNGCKTVKASRYRLHKVVNDLKSCCLLEGKDTGTIRMHDIVHSFAASVATEYDCAYTVAYDTELEEWPGKDVLEKITAISFPGCKIISKLPEVCECPNLESFIFYNSDSSLKIPDSFFNRTKKLKLMDLSQMHLSPMPSSLQFLENLQTLCLDCCELEDITPIYELKKLEVLSFYKSTIVQLPKQLGNLTRLKLLDLRSCQKLEVIPAGVLSRLTRLEELYMRNSFVKWEADEHIGIGNNASLAELNSLPKLVTLEMQVIDVKVLPKHSFPEKLETFKIFYWK